MSKAAPHLEPPKWSNREVDAQTFKWVQAILKKKPKPHPALVELFARPRRITRC
jgi:hypothetical protein